MRVYSQAIYPESFASFGGEREVYTGNLKEYIYSVVLSARLIWELHQ